jgi:formylglycine-generating enzyme required for sulfatase activity
MHLHLRRPSIAVLVLGALTSCGGGKQASQSVRAPELDLTGESRCSVERSQSKPLIVEWPSADRLELESNVGQGLVVVRYVGCEMSLLSRCSVSAGYVYHGATRDHDRVEMKDEDDLYANLPVYAAKFEGKLRRSGRLTVDMNLVGRFEAERANVTTADLRGDCSGATHFVYGVTVGAFDFYAGGKAEIGGQVGIGGIGAGAQSQAERETLTTAGDEGACSRATTADRAPPEGCGALIRIEVVPIRASTSPGEQASSPEPRATAPRVAPSPPKLPPPPPQLPPAPIVLTPPKACPAGMVALPGGTFTMGMRGDTVTVSGLCVDVTEVTTDAYAECVRAGTCSEPNAYMPDDGHKNNRACNWKRPGAGRHPINCVDWAQATSYCGWIGRRLPTEEEWEWAARGASAARTFPWGSEPPTPHRVNACGKECAAWERNNLGRDLVPLYAEDDGWPTTAPVGSFPHGATPQGLQDMAGNVWEWTSSSFDASARIHRGGGWTADDAAGLRVANRNWSASTLHSRIVGFRCVR